MSIALIVVAAAVAIYFTRGIFLPSSKAAPNMFGGPATPANPPPSVAVATDGGSGYFREGQRLFAQGKLDQALEQFEKAIQAAPQNGGYRIVLGETFEKLGRTNDALRVAAEAGALEPRLLSSVARMQARLGSPEAAERSFVAALATKPDDADTLTELTELLTRQKRLGDAAPYFERLATLRPNDAYVVQSLADALAARGDGQRAEGIYRQYLQQKPEDPLVRARFAELLLNTNRVADAIQLTREGVAANPTSPLLQRTLGSLLERDGHPAEAAVAYREYVRLAPNVQDAQQLQERADMLSGKPK